jgi:iron complex outermembrane receptor protein
MPSPVLVLSLAAALFPAAHAQTTADESEAHFQQGTRAYQAGAFNDALLHFLQSNRLSPNPVTAGNVGHTYVARGMFAEAYRWYASALELAPEEKKQTYRDAMASIERNVHLLELTSDPPGATVYLDRKTLGSVAVTPAVIAVGPGDYTILMEKEGHEPFQSSEIAIESVGDRTKVQGELEAILASVEVSGTEGATIRVEETGTALGTVPMTAELVPGPTVLIIEKDGYQPQKVLVSPSLSEKRVVDATLEPVTGQVEILASQRGARVEIDGVLVGYTPVLADLPTGEREVVISLDGYQTVERTIAVSDSDKLQVDAALIPFQQVVTGSGVAESIVDAPASIVVITAEDIRDRGYDDLATLVRDLPGFDNMNVNGTIYQNSFQRGYRTPFTQRTLFLVDGRVENHLWSHMANLSRQYPMTMIERVEVLYGPASAVYGANAFAGIINVVTKNPSTEGVAVDAKVGLGSWDTRVVDGTISGTAGEVRYSVSGRYFGSDEDDLCGEWGFTDCSDFSDPSIWGAFADPGSDVDPARPDPLQANGQNFYEGFANPTDNWAARGTVGFGGLDISASAWSRMEGYGAYYASDKAHPAAQWGYTNRQVYARYTTDVTPRLNLTAEGGWRESRVRGTWAENFGGFLSQTQWSSISNSLNAQLNANWAITDDLRLVSGLTFEHKNLTKAYDIPGYYDAFSSVTLTSVEDDPATGSDYVYLADQPLEGFRVAPSPLDRMPPSNIQPTDDIGAFAQIIADVQKFRFNLGMRIDHNSFYHRPLFSNPDDFQIPDPYSSEEGATTDKQQVALNPRVSAVYRFSDNASAKLLYGEAFQEPAPILVWGGWNGRNGNVNLIPEKARNLEVVGVFRNARLTGEISAFAAFYDNVIVEQAVNTGRRQAFGTELRGSLSLANPIPDSRDIKAFANYTLTAVNSFTDVDENGVYVQVDEPVVLGDIAPHKLNLGFTVPIGQYLSVHNRANIVSSRTPYLANALRPSDYVFAPYAVWNAHLWAGVDKARVGFTINNVLDTHYLVPGAEGANAGNDFDQASAGFNNSAVPVNGRQLLVTLNVDL